MPPAPITAGASPTSTIGNLLAGSTPGAMAADQARAQMEQLASQTTQLGQMADAIAADFPNASQEMAQIKVLLKQAVVKVAQQMPTATASGSAVPSGGSQGPQPM